MATQRRADIYDDWALKAIGDAERKQGAQDPSLWQSWVPEDSKQQPPNPNGPSQPKALLSRKHPGEYLSIRWRAGGQNMIKALSGESHQADEKAASEIAASWLAEERSENVRIT